MTTCLSSSQLFVVHAVGQQTGTKCCPINTVDICSDFIYYLHKEFKCGFGCETERRILIRMRGGRRQDQDKDQDKDKDKDQDQYKDQDQGRHK